jgi:hypothetical protein
MLAVNVLIELLDQRGILKHEQVLERVKKVRAEMKAVPRTQ